MRALLFLVGVLATAQAGAADGGDDERARLSREKAALEARFETRDKECRQRFVVSSCVEEARRERRTALDGVRSRERVLDEARRRDRAEARRAELAAKAADDARRDVERAARAASAATKAEARAAAPEKRPASAPTRSRRTQPANGETAAVRQAREERSRAAFTLRQQQAQAHRQEAEAKAAQRLQKRPPAKPLPLP